MGATAVDVSPLKNDDDNVQQAVVSSGRSMFVRAAGSRLDGPWLSILAALLRRLNAAGKKPDGVSWSGIRSHRVDDCPYLGHFGRRKAPQFGMFLNGGLVFGEIDAEALIVDDIGMLPLSLTCEFGLVVVATSLN